MKKYKVTFFARLPENAKRAIDGGCQCAFCKAHPDKTPAWDTLAVDPDSCTAWTVHYPEMLDPVIVRPHAV
jgi:hypothetical protein